MILNLKFNYTMKKFLFILLPLLFIGFMAFSQERAYYNSTITATQIDTTEADTVTLPILILEPWDVSVQFKATSVSGDSINAVIDVQQSNTTTGDVWVETVTDSAANGTWLYEWRDFQGMRLRFIITGANTDTSSYAGYYTIKRPWNEVKQ